MENPPHDLLEKYNQLYLEVILRYKGHIEQNENLNVAELPKLILPDDESVVTVANRIKALFQSYSPTENFYEAAKFAYEYVKVEISDVSLPIEFWLLPSQTIKAGAGDIFDRATLLCSLLIALGNVTAKVVSVVNSTGRRFIVYFEFKDKVIAFDLEKGLGEFSNREDFIRTLHLDETDDLTAYEFNDKMYNNLA